MAVAVRPWRGFFLVGVILSTSLVYACSGTDKKTPTQVESPRATRIEVSPTIGSFASLGQTIQFSARVIDQFGTAASGEEVFTANWSGED